MREYSLAEIAKLIGASLQGESDLRIKRVASLDEAIEGDISFLDNKKYTHLLAETKASAIIVRADSVNQSPVPVLVTSDPYVAFARVTALFSEIPLSSTGIHPTSIIGKNCTIPSSVSIGPYSVIGDNVVLGEKTQIGAHCVIQEGCRVGENCRLYDRVTLYYQTQLGNQVTIHSGAVLGADGFGFANEKGKWVKIHQLGRVVIGNNVDIGANTTIDRGALKDTLIEDDVIIDNQVQIGHNVKIGQGCAIAACTGIAGSTTIGKYCQLGGAVMINGHITIVDKVQVAGTTYVHRSIDKPGVYASFSVAQSLSNCLKCISIYQQLPEIAKRFQILEKDVSAYLKSSRIKRILLKASSIVKKIKEI